MIVQPKLSGLSILDDITKQDESVQQELRKWLRTVTPKTLGEWVAALPKSNPSATAHQLLHALTTLEDIDLQPMQKFALLDVLRAGSYQAVEALTSGFIGTSSSGFSENFKLLINQAMLLQGQLASAYTHVCINARLLGPQQLFMMGSALHRAVMDHYSMLAFYMQLHLSVPQQVWRQLHRLYKMAEDSQLLTHVMGDNVFVSEQMLTVKQIYIAALLLGSARCSHLQAEDVAIVCKCIKKWVLQADISKQPESGLVWKLAVDLTSGNAAHFETDIPMLTASNWRYVQTKKIIAYMPRQAGITIKIGERNMTPGQDLIKHLISAWSEFVERDNARYPRADTVITCIGFDASHYFLTGGMQLDEFMGQVTEALKITGDRKLLIGSMPEEFVFHCYLPRNINHLTEAKLPSHEVRVIDESITGYCLEWPSDMQGKLSMGGIVSIKESFAPYWKICEIVWINKNGDSIRTGIRTLGNEAIPVAVKVPKNMGERGDILPGFLLTADRDLGTDKASFLVPNVKLQMGEQVRVIQEGNEQTIQLMESIKESSAYSQFDCAFMVMNYAPTSG